MFSLFGSKQIFSLLDLPSLLVLIFLECILSLDNALAIALIVSPLPKLKRKKALWIGVVSSVILRCLAIVMLAYSIQYFWIQILGACYILYLVITYFIRRNTSPALQEKKAKAAQLWKVIIKVEFTDLAFALDSILVALAFIGSIGTPSHALSSKIWIVFIAAIVGIIMMRGASHLLAHLLDRFKNLTLSAYLIMLLISIKLLVTGVAHYFAHNAIALSLDSHQAVFETIFWVLIVIFLLIGFIPKKPKDC